MSKFSQVSLFSGPNNLKDLTMDPRCAGMMGYTEEELRSCFQEHAQTVAKKRKLQEEDVFATIRQWYNR